MNEAISEEILSFVEGLSDTVISDISALIETSIVMWQNGQAYNAQVIVMTVEARLIEMGVLKEDVASVSNAIVLVNQERMETTEEVQPAPLPDPVQCTNIGLTGPTKGFLILTGATLVAIATTVIRNYLLKKIEFSGTMVKSDEEKQKTYQNK